MLAILRQRLNYHCNAAVSSLGILCRTPLSSFMTIFVIAITLAMPGIFWVISKDMQQFSSHWQRSGHISLYLKSPLPKDEGAAFLLSVQKTTGVAQASLKSAAAGLAELRQQEGMEDIMRYLPDNPLPAVIDVTPALEINTEEKLQALYVQLKSFSWVDQAKLDMLWVQRLGAIFHFVSTLAHALMVLLAIAVVVIIGNTLGLAIQRRYDEIQVLRLMGAKDSYIIRPFLYTGLWYGITGGFVAIFLIELFLLSLTWAANQLFTTYQLHYSLSGLSIQQMLTLILFAMTLGWVGACFSVKKQLSV